jgi:hypothetical protein
MRRNKEKAMKNDKTETTEETTEIGKLVAEICENGEHDLAEAIEMTSEALGYAKRLTAIAFGPAATDDKEFVLRIYDRILDRLVDEDDDDEED